MVYDVSRLWSLKPLFRRRDLSPESRDDQREMSDRKIIAILGGSGLGLILFVALVLPRALLRPSPHNQTGTSSDTNVVPPAVNVRAQQSGPPAPAQANLPQGKYVSLQSPPPPPPAPIRKEAAARTPLRPYRDVITTHCSTSGLVYRVTINRT